MSKEYAVVFMEGGLGKIVAATAAIRCLKKAYPDKKIVTVSGYPEVFDRNPHVYRTFRFNENKYLFEEYVKQGTIFERDPYHLDSYRFDEVSLVQAYCDAWGVEFDGSIVPELYLDAALDTITAKQMSDLRQQAKLPVLVVQYMGRSFKDQQSNVFLPSGRENIPLYEKVMQELCEKFVLVLMKLPDEPGVTVPKNVVTQKDPVHFVRWFGYIKNADGFLGVDSCGHHIAAAFRKPAVVCWGRTSHKNLGYRFHTNILGECEERPCNGFMKVPAPGWKCSHDFKCMKSITPEKVTSAVLNMFKQSTAQEEKENATT